MRSVAKKVKFRSLALPAVLMLSLHTAACGSGGDADSSGSSVEFVSAAAITTPQQIFSAVNSPRLANTAVSKQELFSKLGSLSFQQYFNYLQSKATDETVVIGHVQISQSLSQLKDNRSQILAMGGDFSTLSDFWKHAGVSPLSITESQYASSLQTISDYLNSTGIFASLADDIIKATGQSAASTVKLCSNIKASAAAAVDADAISGAAAISGASTGAAASDAAAAAGGASAQLQNALQALGCSSATSAVVTAPVTTTTTSK